MKVKERLNKSFINYFSDLFIIVMVLAWIVEIIIMNGVGIYATIMLGDIYMWSDVANLVSVPLTAGGAIWMIKNSVQHAIANSQGKVAHMDFSKVDTEEYEKEMPMFGEDDDEG